VSDPKAEHTTWTQDDYFRWLDTLTPAQRVAVYEASHFFFTPMLAINALALIDMVVRRDRELAELRGARDGDA